jgi:hypothetical protein
MNDTINSFPHDLGISTRIGLTRGVGQPLGSFAESEIRYREDRAVAKAEHRAQLNQARAESRSRNAAKKSGGTRRELMSRWTTWFQSAQERRSSAGSQSSTGCNS